MVERVDPGDVRRDPGRLLRVGLAIAGVALLVALMLAVAKGLRGPSAVELPSQSRVLRLVGTEWDIEADLIRALNGDFSIPPGQARLYDLDPGGRPRLDGRRAYTFRLVAEPGELTSVEVLVEDGGSEVVAIPGDGTVVPIRIDVPFWGSHEYTFRVETVHGALAPATLRLWGNLSPEHLRLR